MMLYEPTPASTHVHEWMVWVADLRQVGCGKRAGLLQAPPATGPHDQLTADELLKTTGVGSGPVHNAYFLPVGQSAPGGGDFRTVSNRGVGKTGVQTRARQPRGLLS